MASTPSRLAQRYVRAAADWRLRGPDAEEWIARNPNLALGAEWNPPPGPEARARLRELGIDRVPLLAELYALHDGARLPTLGGLRLLPIAEVFDAGDVEFEPLPTPPGDTALIFTDDSELVYGIYLSGPLAGAVFHHDVVFPDPTPTWRSLDEFLTGMLALAPAEDDEDEREVVATLPTTAAGDPHRDADWQVAQQLYGLVRDPASREDPLPLAMQLTPYEHSDALLPYLHEDVEALPLAVAILGSRRWEPARAQLTEIAAWPRAGEARHQNAAFQAQRALQHWDAPDPGGPAR